MRTIALLLACSLAAFAEEENLIKNASFEEPAVQARTVERDGGNPARVADGATSWTQFQSFVRPQDKPGGELVVGMTNQFARTGKQSIFVDFQNLGAQRRSFLITDLLPVKAGHRYFIALWGRTDSKRPLTLDQRRPLLKIDVEYFMSDPEEQCEQTDHRNERIPGSLDRLLFVSTKWTEYFTSVRPPQDAAFMKVTFRWETDREAGTTDGAIYFDDASITAVPGGGSLAPLDPVPANPPAPGEAAPPKENR
ncbi:MAG: hypothetical protein ABMA13_01510 [Chthoniobacteraceae bacterium]